MKHIPPLSVPKPTNEVQIAHVRVDHSTDREPPPPGNFNTRERVLRPGKATRMADGATYVLTEKGALVRTDKPKGTKKQRRKQRAQIKKEIAKIRSQVIVVPDTDAGKEEG